MGLTYEAWLLACSTYNIAYFTYLGLSWRRLTFDYRWLPSSTILSSSLLFSSLSSLARSLFRLGWDTYCTDMKPSSSLRRKKQAVSSSIISLSLSALLISTTHTALAAPTPQKAQASSPSSSPSSFSLGFSQRATLSRHGDSFTSRNKRDQYALTRRSLDKRQSDDAPLYNLEDARWVQYIYIIYHYYHTTLHSFQGTCLCRSKSLPFFCGNKLSFILQGHWLVWQTWLTSFSFFTPSQIHCPHHSSWTGFTGKLTRFTSLLHHHSLVFLLPPLFPQLALFRGKNELQGNRPLSFLERLFYTLLSAQYAVHKPLLTVNPIWIILI